MSRSVSSFRRTGAKFKTQPRILVLCEDSKSSKNYLEEAAIYYRSYALVEFHHCGRTDPLGIVEAAIKRLADFDFIYCVIDRDDHANFDAAILLAKGQPNLAVLTSYPCFELWLLLHFCFTRAPYRSIGNASAADRLIADLQKKPGMAEYAKGKSKDLFKLLLPRIDNACNHAKRTLQEAEADGESNPSTPLHILIDKLKYLAELQVK